MNLAAALLLGTLALAPGEPAPVPSVQDLVWLSGCWESIGGEPGSVEIWTRPAGGTLLGLGRTVKGGKTVAHELMQIRETAPGRIVFIALPSGQTEATFPLVRLAGHEVVFENPGHDFPQRVIYRRENDLLTGRIEGVENGREKGFDFPLKKAACD